MLKEAKGYDFHTIKELGAGLDLVLSDLGCLPPIVRYNELLESDGSSDIASLPDVCEDAGGFDDKRLETAQAHMVRMLGNFTGRCKIGDSIGKSLDVIRRRAAATSNRIHQAILCPLTKRGSHGGRTKVVATHCVRQAGVGIGVRVAGGTIR